MPEDRLKAAMNLAYEFCEARQRELDEGRITEEEWFDAHCRFFTANYLGADNPRAQAGHYGDEAAYRYTRGMILEAIHRGGSFLDVGCANGHLVEMLDRWLSGAGLAVEFYGLDISEGLLALARERLPEWRDRFFLGNALTWQPPRQWDYVCVAELGYVPRAREERFFRRLFEEFVAPGGRLILGPGTEEVGNPVMEEKVRAWGFVPTGFCEKSHQKLPELRRRMFWFDRT